MRSIPEFGNFEVHIMRLTLSTLVFGLLVAQGAMAAGDGTAAVGGGLGGALGNVVGQQMGGSTGAAIGAGVGGAAGGAGHSPAHAGIQKEEHTSSHQQRK